jgi:hypothetical protein
MEGNYCTLDADTLRYSQLVDNPLSVNKVISCSPKRPHEPPPRERPPLRILLIGYRSRCDIDQASSAVPNVETSFMWVDRIDNPVVAVIPGRMDGETEPGPTIV